MAETEQIESRRMTDEEFGAFTMAMALNRVHGDGSTIEQAARAFQLDPEAVREAYEADPRTKERRVIEAVREWREVETRGTRWRSERLKKLAALRAAADALPPKGEA